MSSIPWKMQLAFVLWKYPPLLILSAALVGNTLSFIVLSRASIANSSVSVYLRVVAITDTVTVVCGLLPPILDQWVDVSVELLHSSLCVLRRFVMFSAADTAVWLIGALSVDRMVLVVMPLRGRQWCRRRRASGIVCAFFLLSVVKNCATFFTLALADDPVTNRTTCTTRDKFLFYETKVRPWISLVLFYIVTALVIIVCNSLIIYKITRASQKRAKLNATEKQNTQKSANSLTKMMIAVTLLFIFLITPTMIIWTAVGQWEIKSVEDTATVMLFFACTDILTFSNHSLNFILYVLSGRRFREELVSLFSCGVRVKSRSVFVSSRVS